MAKVAFQVSWHSGEKMDLKLDHHTHFDTTSKFFTKLNKQKVSKIKKSFPIQTGILKFYIPKKYFTYPKKITTLCMDCCNMFVLVIIIQI